MNGILNHRYRGHIFLVACIVSMLLATVLFDPFSQNKSNPSPNHSPRAYLSIEGAKEMNLFTVLTNLKPEDVRADPYPHIIVKDALPDSIYQVLAKEFPTMKQLAEIRKNTPDPLESYGNNKRINIKAFDSLKDPIVSPTWKSFIRNHTSNSFLRKAFELFEPHIRKYYHHRFEKFSQRDDFKIIVRKDYRSRDESRSTEFFVDAQIAVNSPVTEETHAVRLVHVDDPDKLFVGLLYMRDPQDKSKGGDLGIYRRTLPGEKGCPEDDRVVRVDTVHYEKNVLIFFLNTPDSFHGVTVREVTPYPRRFANLVTVLPPHFGRLFDLQDFKEHDPGRRYFRIFGLEIPVWWS